MEFKISGLQELNGLARKILDLNHANIFLFEGDLGAGKTTFIKAFCAELGSTDEVTSPTFSLVNEYGTEKNGKIFHFDFYRIKSPEEAMDIGFEEYLYNKEFCFIEWPEKIMKLLYGKYVIIQVKAEDQSRIIKVHLS